ncbi:hypothetical protein [Pseudonocardia broussonetiae]|uniref:Uncharacterized protein n=1 Tax=Pseudonocardia broussonetiae TaxID=2736640 RepID=A0A6M6JPL0_9PSEU|nr:hypothetical protein [Pseudonocardia broussonetiae]QJY48369.1 hypothetical protein HOP40_23385 [Pseudonocardia broussonetiae]
MAVPATRLDADLATLLARAGARTVRVVDGRAGSVVAEAGDAASGPDDPAAVAGLLREAVALGEGGLDDVLVTTDRSLHVLRPAPVAGVFVHLRLDLGADPVRARRALADPALQDAVRRAVTADPVPDLTTPLRIVPGPAPATSLATSSATSPAAPPPAPSAVAATFGPAPVLPARVPPSAVGSAVGPAVGEDGPVLAEPVDPPSDDGVPTTAVPVVPAAGPPSVPPPTGRRPAGSPPTAPPRRMVGPAPTGGGGLFAPVTPAHPEAPAGPAPAGAAPAGPAPAGPAPAAPGPAAPAHAAATAWTDPATEPALAGPGATGPGAPGPDAAGPGPGPGPLPLPRPADAGAPDADAPEADAPEADAAHPAPTARRTRPATPGQQPALTVLASDRARSGAGARAAVALAELSRPDAPPVVLPRRRATGTVRSVPAPRSGGSTSGLPDRAWAKDLDTLRRLADGLRRLS